MLRNFILLLIMTQVSIVFGQYNLNKKDKTKPLAFQEDLYIPSKKSQRKKNIQKTFYVPLLLISAGLFAETDNEVFSSEEYYEERNEHIPNFHTHVDDYLQYAPIAAVYGLNLMGVKGKNDFVNRTAILVKAELIVSVLTYSIKKASAVTRPDSSTPNSFPSGHTAQAFAAATFMAKEYGDVSIWYSVGAYSMATSVGVMRVLNNRHWVSDVLVGAGIGILSTNLAYLTHQYRWGKKKKGGHTLIVPSYDGQTGMVSIIHQFN